MFTKIHISYPPHAQQTRTLAERMALAHLDTRRAHALAWMRSHKVPVLLDAPHTRPWPRKKPLPNPPF